MPLTKANQLYMQCMITKVVKFTKAMPPRICGDDKQLMQATLYSRIILHLCNKANSRKDHHNISKTAKFRGGMLECMRNVVYVKNCILFICF